MLLEHDHRWGQQRVAARQVVGAMRQPEYCVTQVAGNCDGLPLSVGRIRPSKTATFNAVSQVPVARAQGPRWDTPKRMDAHLTEKERSTLATRRKCGTQPQSWSATSEHHGFLSLRHCAKIDRTAKEE